MAIQFEKEKERKRIGARITQLRDQRHLTQEELAAAAGINRVTLTNIELGKFSVGSDILCKIAQALNCTLDFIEN